jgi:hypothetical protein
MFFASVTYNNDLTPFQGASVGWAVPRVEWREDKECMGSFRPETEGHENLAQGFNP